MNLTYFIGYFIQSMLCLFLSLFISVVKMLNDISPMDKARSEDPDKIACELNIACELFYQDAHCLPDEFFEKVDFEKIQQTTRKVLPSMLLST